MPTDASTNLATSAAAAFCARLCVHPLDHLKASLPGSEGATVVQSSSRNIYDAIHRHLSLHQDQPRQQEASVAQSKIRKQYPHHHHQTFRERIQLWRGLYKGVPFALFINVPALAFFLSTYDATKHGLAYLSTEWNISRFHLYHFETHLISGLMAKVAGTFLWAPMIQLQTMQAQTRGQSVAVAGARLSLRDACGLIKKMGRSAEGLMGLWSGYGSTLTSLLPYTMLYFATYEQLKQLARWVIINRSGLDDDYSKASSSGSNGQGVAFNTLHENPLPLYLGTYMICVSGAVTISAAVCHSASALRVHLLESLSRNPNSLLERAKNSVAASSKASPSSGTRTSITPAMAALSPPQSHQTLLASAHMSSKLQSQHAHLTTTATATTSIGTRTMVKSSLPQPLPQQQTTYIRRPLLREPNHATMDAKRVTAASSTSSSSTSRFLRQISRGLGPRILWTAPGVTLTTAGFEVFRNMALGVV